MPAHNLVKTGVLEEMAGRSCTVAEPAAALQLHSSTFVRVLRMTSTLEITQEHDHFSLTSLGRAMLKNIPGSLHTNFMLIGSDAY